jgi:FKBP-type peptidyl-prolyl cis-trans isomerase
MRLSTSTLLLACAAVTVPGTNAWMTTSQTRSTTSLQAAISRQDFFKQAAATAVVSATFAGIWQPASALAKEAVSLPNGVTYTITKKGDGPQPSIGELAAIRFAAYFGDVKIDDIFDTPEPYYTRVGSGALVKGVEDVLPLMVLGDRWVLTIPVSTVQIVSCVFCVLCGNCMLPYLCMLLDDAWLGNTYSHLFLNNIIKKTERIGVWQKGSPRIGGQAPDSR